MRAKHAVPVFREVPDPHDLIGRGRKTVIDWHAVGDTEQVWLRSAWDARPIFHRIREWQPDIDSWAYTVCGRPRFWPCNDQPCRAAGTPCGHYGASRGETVPYRFLNARIARPCRRCFSPARAVDIVKET